MKVTRRQFLRLAAGAAVAAEVAYVNHTLQPYGLLNILRWRSTGLLRNVRPSPTVVAVEPCASYDDDLVRCLSRAADAIGGVDVRGRRVVLKANLVHAIPDRPATTDPAVIDATIRFFQARGASEVVVTDGSAFRMDTAGLLHESGVGRVLKARGVPFIDLNYDDLVNVPLKGGYSSIPSLWIPRTIVEADYLVSLPKLKCHHWTTVSLSTKNLFGIVPGSRYGWPKNLLHWTGIPLNILALYATFRPHLNIVDGVVGMEGDGPLMGTSRDSRLLIMGTDGIAVDATGARLMGIEPMTAKHLELAHHFGIGNVDIRHIQVRGAAISDLRLNYELPPALPEGDA